MSKANPEQLVAIEHQGGFLLKAGAGSGKTFVLVEHIIYLLKKEQKNLNSAMALKERLSEIVMMTFTNKASAEMQIRLYKRVAEEIEKNSEDKAFWELVYQYLPLMTISTIDGFCKKLLSQGHFPDISAEASVISSSEREHQILELFDEWLSKARLPDFIKTDFLFYRSQMIQSFSHIFGSPDTRIKWEKFDLNSLSPAHLSQWSKEAMVISGLSEIAHEIRAYQIDESKKLLAFEQMIKDLQGLPFTQLPEFAALKAIASYFEGKRLTGPSKKTASPEAEFLYEMIKDFKEWILDWVEVAHEYQENFESKIKPWILACQDFFTFVRSRLDLTESMTFADLEYQVLNQLRFTEGRRKVQAQYKYFIVDEFQDTSWVQFEIISLLIENNYSRLFAVGDSKQAIYGFRGGELGVFRECEKLIPKVASLVTNYRSNSSVIEFNNLLFDFILKSGEDFEGEELVGLDLEHQKAAPDALIGEIKKYQIDFTNPSNNELKILTSDIEQIEAASLAEIIEKESKDSGRIQVILYRKLTPSNHLIREFLHKKLSFSAQFKFLASEEPGLMMASLLIGYLNAKDKETYLKWINFYGPKVTAFLGVEVLFSKERLDRFVQDMAYWGLPEAMEKFFYSSSLTNENYDLNIQWLRLMSQLHQADPEMMELSFSENDDEKISLEIHYGRASDKIQIMSAHASKGLEFDIVYLAGIYTNGRSQDNRVHFGQEPGSFKWLLSAQDKKYFSTPLLMLEAQKEKRKNQAESKRLFYVACTRAKESLRWIDIDSDYLGFSIPKNSWIKGIKKKDQSVPSEKLQFDLQRLELGNNLDRPLFHYDPMGFYPFFQNDLSELLILPELSVTKMTTLKECPRKFYLKHTLKLQDPRELAPLIVNDEGEEKPLSSSERGSLLHSILAESVSHNFIVPLEHFEIADRPQLEWALDLLKKMKEKFEIHPEETLKFKFFNTMISGIPDVYFIPKNEGAIEIWDYKTGRMSEAKLGPYFAQLKIYAYALMELHPHLKNLSPKLKIVALDEKKLYEINQTIAENEQEMRELWLLMLNPEKVNLDHCSICPYSEFCPR